MKVAPSSCSLKQGEGGSFRRKGKVDQGEIILYQPEGERKLEVRLEKDTVWLNRQQMAILFGRDVKTIGKHINNASREELDGMATIAKFATVQTEGGREVIRNIEYYNLDMILSVGYRVKSAEGIKFRQWANKVLKEYLLKGYSVNSRFERLEQRVAKTEEKLDFFVRTSLPPVEGIFFNGQIFDAYVFVSDLIKSAKQRIVLIDNYIDESVLLLMAKRRTGVTAELYTGQISQQLKTDINRHNEQYAPLKVSTFCKSHDRFLIIDDKVYLIGASIKDLGKRWFAFTELNSVTANDLLSRLQ